MDIRQESLKKHYEWNGKIEVISRAPINTREDLSLAYTPGVAEPCLEINKDVTNHMTLRAVQILLRLLPMEQLYLDLAI